MKTLWLRVAANLFDDFANSLKVESLMLYSSPLRFAGARIKLADSDPDLRRADSGRIVYASINFVGDE